MEKTLHKKTHLFNFSPTQILLIGLIFIILIGALLLSLPISNKTNNIGFVDALFVSTAGICVTGLTPVVPVNQFTIFGQVILLLIIQTGGLGFLTFYALLLAFLRKKIGLRNRMLLKESLNQYNFSGIIKLIFKIVKYTLIIELIGAICLMFSFIPEYGLLNGMYYSIFHSVSAFCNAGFDIIGASSLAPFKTNIIVNISIMMLIIIGGLGFNVWHDITSNIHYIFNKEKKSSLSFKNLSLHTKIVLITTVFLLITGTILILFFERNNVKTIGNENIGDKILISSFQSTILRSAGFSTINQENMTLSSKFISMIYMFIGGSPGSTAGGIKTVTVFLLFITILSVLKNQHEVVIFKRYINSDIIKRAIVIIILSFSLICVATIILISVQNHYLAREASESEFVKMLFEVISAFSIVGLSLNYTSSLSVRW